MPWLFGRLSAWRSKHPVIGRQPCSFPVLLKGTLILRKVIVTSNGYAGRIGFSSFFLSFPKGARNPQLTPQDKPTTSYDLQMVTSASERSCFYQFLHPLHGKYTVTFKMYPGKEEEINSLQLSVTLFSIFMFHIFVSLKKNFTLK